MKTIILGDLHVKPSNKDLIHSFLDSLSVYAQDIGAKRVILLGDLYNQRAVIRSELQRMLMQSFSNMLKHGIEQIDIVVGNHDLDSLDMVEHSLDVFNWVYPRYIRVHTHPLKINDEIFIPFTRDYNKVSKILEDSEGSIVYCHLPITGFMLAPRLMEKNGVPLGWFSKAKKVFAGHFHAQQEKENVIFPGSILVNTYSEAGMDPMFIVIDGDTGSRERVKALCPQVPRYYIHEVGNEWVGNLDWDNNYHKFIITGNVLQDCVNMKNRIVALAREFKPHSLQFQYITERIEGGKINENMSLEEIFCNFIDEDSIPKSFMKRTEKEEVKKFGLDYMRAMDA